MILARLENLLTVAVINLKKLLTRNELKLIIIMNSHPTYEELKLENRVIIEGHIAIHILPMRN